MVTCGGGGLAHAVRSLFLPAYLNHLSVLLPLPHTLYRGPRLPAPGWLSQAGSPPVAVSPARAHTLGPAHIHLFSCLSPSSWALFLSPSLSVAWMQGPPPSPCTPKCGLHPQHLGQPFDKNLSIPNKSEPIKAHLWDPPTPQLPFRLPD